MEVLKAKIEVLDIAEIEKAENLGIEPTTNETDIVIKLEDISYYYVVEEDGKYFLQLGIKGDLLPVIYNEKAFQQLEKKFSDG